MLPALRRTGRGIRAAVRARPGVLALVAAGAFVLHLSLPPLVLSLSRKPVDFFSFNPWLRRLPEFLASDEVPLARKLEFLPNLALFWFSADSPYGTEWAFHVEVRDLARFAMTSLLIGLFFALWAHDRARRAPGGAGWAGPAGGSGGLAGAVTGMLGLSTGPCSVTGCGAPVIPVVGLAFTGLSSGTLALLATLSRAAAIAVMLLMAAGTVAYGWRAGRPDPTPRA
ncbi:MAG: hypothetical protein ACREMB_26155 [Candidatus Rokuibacteriota bacterium]